MLKTVANAIASYPYDEEYLPTFCMMKVDITASDRRSLAGGTDGNVSIRKNSPLVQEEEQLRKKT